MKVLYYDRWYKKRLDKVLNIFGKDWFIGKKVLELGACEGNTGIELLKIGADVTFADLRQTHLDVIKDKLSCYNINAKTILLNQEQPYNFHNKFDLILHLGVLCHVENWQQDLECAIKSSKNMILETTVSYAMLPNRIINSPEKDIDFFKTYLGENGKQSLVCQESIESFLLKMGSKFIRFDNQELNTVSNVDETVVKFLYDWDYNTATAYRKSASENINTNLNLRRFYLIIND